MFSRVVQVWQNMSAGEKGLTFKVCFTFCLIKSFDVYMQQKTFGNVMGKAELALSDASAADGFLKT